MYSAGDTPKGWVAPFGYPRIKACSRLPMAFRSVPRPSSPPGAKASTECPSHTQSSARHPLGTDNAHHHAQEPLPVRHQTQATKPQMKSDDQRCRRSTITVCARHTQTQLLLQTPLNTAAMPGGTILRMALSGSPYDPFRSDKSPGTTTDKPPPRPKPAPKRQPSRNRVVLRAQRRTRTRFTTQKNKPSHAAKRSAQRTRHRQPPHALGGTPANADRGSIP